MGLSSAVPGSLRKLYGASAVVGFVATGLMARIEETIPVRKAFSWKTTLSQLARPLSFTRLLRQKRLRLLTILLALQYCPIFMGEVLQIFAIEEWGLSTMLKLILTFCDWEVLMCYRN